VRVCGQTSKSHERVTTLWSGEREFSHNPTTAWLLHTRYSRPAPPPHPPTSIRSRYPPSLHMVSAISGCVHTDRRRRVSPYKNALTQRQSCSEFLCSSIRHSRTVCASPCRHPKQEQLSFEGRSVGRWRERAGRVCVHAREFVKIFLFTRAASAQRVSSPFRPVVHTRIMHTRAASLTTFYSSATQMAGLDTQLQSCALARFSCWSLCSTLPRPR
jgi:hypothetical protein